MTLSTQLIKANYHLKPSIDAKPHFLWKFTPLIQTQEIISKSDIERFPYFNVLDYHY